MTITWAIMRNTVGALLRDRKPQRPREPQYCGDATSGIRVSPLSTSA